MSSVLIAAHNEATVLGACLDALATEHDDTAMQIIVSANGCIDTTTQVADSRGVVVVDRAEAGKSGALNAAEEIATEFPRFYLDADIIVPAGCIRALSECLDCGALAAVPRRRIDTSGRPLFVRGYFAINERLPAFRSGLFGRGMIAVSREGRARFAQFPPMIADDLFLDSQFSASEKSEASGVEVVVQAPHTTRALVNRLVRVRRGNFEMREASANGEIDVTVRASDKWAWLRDVVLPEPRLALAAIPYVLITLTAALRARQPVKGAQGWGRDDSTRTQLLLYQGPPAS